MKIGIIAAACAAVVCAATPARAAYLFDTGYEAPAVGTPVSAGTSPYAFATGSGHYAQFTLDRDTRITGIEFYGTVATAGVMYFSIFFADRGTEALGTIRQHTERIVGQQLTAGWVGNTSIPDLELQAGNWWVSAYSPGTMTGQHYRAAAGQAFDQELTSTIATVAAGDDGANLSWRISGAAVEAAAPVPEPASWAMMLGGLGAAGAALRRRRARVVLA